MTRKRSSPLGLELVVSALLALMLLPLLIQAAPFKDATEIQQYTEGCYYNYNHYNEGDRILTNEPCLNCTCHNKMLMCYLRVCPFTKPIGHDCVVEKREDQCCPIITCPEVPVDIAHHIPEPGTELSIPEKYGCSIEDKFYPEGAQVPSNPNKPCELCYCIKNRTSCLMQECTLHIDGCQPIYNKGSCCPVRYNCDHENDVLELEDHSSSTTTTVRPTPGFVLTTTSTPAISTDCVHNGERYADGASLTGKNACEHCYCMRGDIVCAVQECEMPMLDRNGKSCRALPPAEGQCCPSNYVCEDESATTQIVELTTQAFVKEEATFTTTPTPKKDLHGTVSQEDIELQKHIDEDIHLATAAPATGEESKPAISDELGSGDFATESDVEDMDHTTSAAEVDEEHDIAHAPTVSEVSEPNTTLSPSTGVQDEIDETSESVIDLDHKILSPDKKFTATLDHTTAFADTAEEQTTASADTTVEVKKEQEEIAGAAEQTTASADVTIEGDKKHDEPLISDETTISSAETEDKIDQSTASHIDLDHTTQSTEKVGEETALGVDQTTVSADATDEEKKEEEKPATAIEQATLSAEKTDEIDENLDETTVSHDTTTEVDKKHDEPSTDLDQTTVSAVETADIDKKQEVPEIIAEHTTVSATDVKEEIDQSTEFGDVFDHTATSGEKEGEESATGMDQVTLSPGTTGDVRKDHEEPAIVVEQTTVTADKIGEIEKQTEEPAIEKDHATVATDTTAEVDKKHEEPSIEMDQTTISAGEVDKKHEGPVIALDQTTVSADEDLAVDVDHTTVPSETTGEVDKKYQVTDIKLDQTTVSADATVEVDKKHEVPAVDLDRTTIRPEASSDLEKEEDVTSGNKEEESVEADTTSVPLDFADRIDDTTVSVQDGSKPDKKPEAEPTVTEGESTVEKDTTVTPTVDKEDKISSTSASTEASTSVEDEDLASATTSAELSPESVEETSEEEEKLDVTTVRPDVTEDIKKEHKLESATEKLPTTEGSGEEEIDEDITDKTETVETTSVKSDVSATEADVGKEKPVQITPIEIEEKTEAAPTSTEIADKFESITDKIGESVDTTIATPTKAEPEIKASTSAPIPDDSKDEETTSAEEQERTTAKPSIAEEVATSSTLGVTTVFKDEQDIEVAATTIATDISASQPVEKETVRPIISEEISTEKVFDLEKIPSVIPGEGNCLVGQNTYSHNADVPISNACETACRCINSIIVCENVKCSIPQNMEKCILDESSKDQCCPKFVCDGEQIDTTEATLQKETTPATPGKGVEETPTFTPNEIEMPTASTEEPMSHVKDEIEKEEEPAVTHLPKLDMSVTATDIPTYKAEKPVITPEDTIPHDKVEDESITQEPIVDHTIAIKLHEKPSPETIPVITSETVEKESTEETVTLAPVDKVTETTEEILSVTSATDVEKEAEASISEEEPIASVTEIPEGIEAHTATPTEKAIATETGTTAPTDEKNLEDESLAQTAAPAFDEKKEILEHTTATFDDIATTAETLTFIPSVKGDEKEVIAHTIAPVVDSEVETATSTAEDKTVQPFGADITTPLATSDAEVKDHTPIPRVEDSEEHILSHTSVPALETDKETETQTTLPLHDEYLAQTVVPTAEKEIIKEEESTTERETHTAAPSTDSKKEETLEKEKKPIDEPLATTATPIEIDSATSTVRLPESEEKGADTTETPSVEAEKDDTIQVQLAHTDAPVAEEDSFTAHTLAPSSALADDHTIAATAESEKEEESTPRSPITSVEKLVTVTPSIEVDTHKPQDGETQEGSAESTVEEELTAQGEDSESTEDITEDHTTISSMRGQEKETGTEIASSTPAVQGEGRPSIDESLEHKTTPAIDEESDVKLAHTSTPEFESDKEAEEATKAPIYAPSTVVDTETKAGVEEQVEIQTEVPSTTGKEKETLGDSLAHTVAPYLEAEESSTEDSTKAPAPVTLDQKEKDEVYKDGHEGMTVQPSIDESEESESEEETSAPITESAVELTTEDATAVKEVKEKATVKPALGLEEEEAEENVSKISTADDAKKDSVDEKTPATPLEEDTKDKEVQTHVPHVEVDGTTEDITKAHTTLPSFQDADKRLDESLAHTSTPAIDYEEATKTPTTQVEEASEEFEDFTKSSVETTASDMEHETQSVEESEEDTKAHTLAPIAETDEKKTTDELLKPSKTATEKIPAAATIKEDHTTSTDDDKRMGEGFEDHTIPSAEHKTEITAPQAEVKKDTEAETETSIPAIEIPEKKPIDEALAQTIEPGKEIAEVPMDVTSISPVAGEEEKDFVKHTTVSGLETETSTVAPSIPAIGEKHSDEPLAHTVAPVDIKKGTEDVSKVETIAPAINDKEKATTIATTEIEKETAEPSIDHEEKETVTLSTEEVTDTSAEIEKATTAQPIKTVDTRLDQASVPSIEDKTEAVAEETTEIFLATSVDTLVEGDAETEDATKSSEISSEEEKETETMAHTIAPAAEKEKETVAPAIERNETLAHTTASVIDDEQVVTKSPLDTAEDKESQTVATVEEEKPIEETATSVPETVKSDIATKSPVEEESEVDTSAPLGGAEEQTTSTLKEDKPTVTEHAAIPSSTISTKAGEKEPETSTEELETKLIDETTQQSHIPSATEKVETGEPAKAGEEKETTSHTTLSPVGVEKETQYTTFAEGEQTTRSPAVVASLDSVEGSEESVESEEELTTTKVQPVGAFVTERSEVATEVPHKVDSTPKPAEVEASGEEGEDMQEFEIDTKKPISSSTVKPAEETETSSSIEGEEEQTTSKVEAEIVEPTQVPLEAVTSGVAKEVTTPAHKITEATEQAQTEAGVGIEVTTPVHKITEAQTEAAASEEETLKPQTEDMPTRIHTGIGITEESATEKTESSEEGEEQKESDEQKESEEHTSTEGTTASEEKGEQEEKPTTTVHPLFGKHTTSTYLPPPLIGDRIGTKTNASETATVPEATTTTTTTSAPVAQYPPPAAAPSYGSQPPQYPSYPEDEYTDEDETEVFGPGTCRYGGKLFVSAQQIPRDDPCDFCFCFRSDIICLQQSCPPPISGCHEEPISGFCCPRYECPVSMATVLNITTSTTTTSTTLPPHFLHHAYQGAAEKNGCHINGKSYQVGEKIDSTSGPCMHCTCGGDGQMKCDPKTCSPEPMLRQMIAVVASRRR